MTPEEIEECWRDPRNRRWGVYCCRSDPRVIVPRHARWMGWTVNVAHPSAIPVVLLLLSCIAVPTTVESAMGTERSVVLLTGAVGIAVMCLLCVYLSSTISYRGKTPMDS